MQKIRGVDILRIWILSAVHLIFGTFFLGTGIFELLKLEAQDISGMYIWLKLVIGASIIILGIIFVKNTFKPSRNSFFNVN